jgi:hypothetical protein
LQLWDIGIQCINVSCLHTGFSILIKRSNNLWMKSVYPSHDLRFLSTSGRYCTCWNFWCLKAVASPTSRCEEISLFCRMLEKPQSSLKVDSQFCYLKKWEIPPIFIAWVIGLKVLGKVFKYHEPPCLPICSLLLALLQNLISFINFSTFMFSNCWIKKISVCKKTSKTKGEVSNDSAPQKKLF